MTQALDAFTRLIEGVFLLKQQLIFKIQFYTILHNFAIFCEKRKDFWNRLYIAAKESEPTLSKVGVFNKQSHFSSTAEA